MDILKAIGITILIVIGIVSLIALFSFALKDKVIYQPDVVEFSYKDHSYLRFKSISYGDNVLHDPDCSCFKN